LDRKLNIGIFENHDEMIKLAENAGVFYKPTGSGGGELGHVISNDRMRIEEVCPRLNSRGFNYFQV
jgi:mevalonate kinase